MKKRIVIVGGGFAGVYVARELERLARRGDDLSITLVSQENYFVFQPMLPEVISGTIGLVDVVSPLRRLLPRTDINVREVEAIDLQRRVVVTSPGFRPQAHEIPYDHLVIALGAVTDFRGMRGLPEHAFPFKNLGDAIQLRNHVIRTLEEASVERDDHDLRRELLTFVVAGGGFSGVEVVAELNDFVRRVARNYPAIDPRELRVILLHSGDRILPEMSEGLARFAEKILTKRGVDVRLNTRLTAATGVDASLGDGTKIQTRTLVSTVPAFPHPLLDSLALPKSKNGRLLVDRELRVEGCDDLWSLGDCATVPTPDGGTAPPTAQHAIREAAVVANNIAATIRGGPRRTFDFRGLGKMGSLGHRSAVAEILGVKISGFLAWWIWRTIYLMKMPGWGRRVKVAVSWSLDLFLPPELVQLRVGSSRGISREHFEPGQDVFREGDLGDRIYIIVRGEADVVKNVAGEHHTVARLRAGECFGEMALLNESRRSATIRCVEPMDALSLPKREFTALAANLPELRSSFQRIADSRRADVVTRSQQVTEGHQAEH